MIRFCRVTLVRAYVEASGLWTCCLCRGMVDKDEIGRKIRPRQPDQSPEMRVQ